MEDLRHIIVSDHIGDLRREGDRLRAERTTDRSTVHDHGGGSLHAHADRGAARVRLGHWLIGVGTAVAGPATDRHGGAAGHAT
jgi:hypothetical protein